MQAPKGTARAAVFFFLIIIIITIIITQASKPSGTVQREKQADTKQRTRLSGGKGMRLFSQYEIYRI